MLPRLSVTTSRQQKHLNGRSLLSASHAPTFRSSDSLIAVNISRPFPCSSETQTPARSPGDISSSRRLESLKQPGGGLHVAGGAVVSAFEAVVRAGFRKRRRAFRADGLLDELHGAAPAALS